jgi:acyl-CoA hydrolase
MKIPQDSFASMMEIVLPNDTNTLNNLRGGKILHWMDICSAISAGRHAESVVVTVTVDHVSFENPIKMGDVVTITSKVTRAFNTSIETKIEVWAENIPSKTKYQCNTAYYTFVALDSNSKPKKVELIEPQTEEEKIEFNKASQRRELRLLLAGRIKPSDAKELKSLIEEE